jgi:RimJ/RimL family protein N-acetyltransferase
MIVEDCCTYLRKILHDHGKQAAGGENCGMSGVAEGSRDGQGGTEPQLSEARLRTARPGDAAALLRLKQWLDQETSFMLLEPGERDTSVPALARELEDLARSGHSAVIVAERAGDSGTSGTVEAPAGELPDGLAGYLELTGGTFRRNRATAYLVMGVLAAAGGRGIGTALLAAGKRWAAAHGLHRLELTVMAHNGRAFDLYSRMGFSVEGRRSECLLVDGRFVDELYMAAILD